MSSSLEQESPSRAYLLPNKRLPRILVIGVVFAAALAARLYKIDNPPVDYQPVRQYRSALIARAYYYRRLDAIPKWERAVAESNLATEPRLEVPIMEYLTSLVYRVVGGEHLWIPRMFSSIFWLIGGAFLYTIARRIASRDAALLATAFYLFLPFGVITSRNFQRDVPMLMLMLISMFLLVRHADRPSLGILLSAALVSSLAIFIKPICAPLIFGVAIALGIHRTNQWTVMLNARFILFSVIALVPTIVYTWYGMFFETFLTEQAQRSFLPSLMRYPFFWHGWLSQIARTVGYPALSIALFGLFVFRDAFSRALAIGLWTGYVVFGLIFNIGIYTHSYYQLMLIPIVALSLTPAAQTVLCWLQQPLRPRYLQPVTRAVLVFAACVSLEPVLWDRADPQFARTVALCEEIADAVGHSTKTIILDDTHGKVLKYHGKMCGDWWPSCGDLRQFELWGQPEMSAEQRLDEKIKNDAPEFFVIAWTEEFKEQKDLRELLTTRYRKFREVDEYIIFDMRTRLDL